MKDWQRIEPTTVTKVGYRTVVTKTFIMSNGEKGTFDTFGNEGQEFVAVIGLTPDNQVVIARQFRFGPEKIMEELPGGFVEKDEDPETAARREFLEETGYKPGEMRYLGAHQKDAYMNALWHFFIAEGCVQLGEQKLDTEEQIEIDVISVAKLIENSKTNKMTDSAAVLMAYDELTKV